jgi:hypothetical protein
MSSSDARRQRLLARKRNAKTANPNSAASWSMAVRATTAPIHECLVPVDLFTRGIGNLVISRALADGRIAVAVFLLDVFCLGVKSALYAVVSRDEYARRVRTLSAGEHPQQMQPACFCTLIEGAVAYAQDLGFQPHADYAVARQLFGTLTAEPCPEQFQYGHENMPYYISGPNETKTDAQRIVEQLTRRLGPNKFHYLVVVQ